ncbi:hypothetical protein M5G25_17090 [Pseudomonas sp. TNT2022 ID357]|uniref:Uncharacterized protein n=1 Tax=Pseudomonas idahonensis TaxID=2942628 RepID=A0ABT5Q8E7_9PSED|nr:hypothetical protein [Pseudomonas idahonensis]MDD1150006.1 hypothetical protein [Pseudomonas idahonensis]
MPTETQHLEQRVAALQSDLNTKDEQIDALTFSDNHRELSRRDWFEAAQAAEKRVEMLEGQLAERDALLGDVLDGKHTTPGWNQRMKAALSASAEPIAKQELQLEDPERQRLIAWGRNCGLEEASKVCQRMAHEAYYPPGTRFKHFTPKAQMRLGDILIKAANAIGGLPDGPYERFHARQGNKTR